VIGKVQAEEATASCLTGIDGRLASFTLYRFLYFRSIMIELGELLVRDVIFGDYPARQFGLPQSWSCRVFTYLKSIATAVTLSNDEDGVAVENPLRDGVVVAVNQQN
jgi:hypothetical protein